MPNWTVYSGVRASVHHAGNTCLLKISRKNGCQDQNAYVTYQCDDTHILGIDDIRDLHDFRYMAIDCFAFQKSLICIFRLMIVFIFVLRITQSLDVGTAKPQRKFIFGFLERRKLKILITKSAKNCVSATFCFLGAGRCPPWVCQRPIRIFRKILILLPKAV